MKRDPDDVTESAYPTSPELSDADTRFLDDLGAHVRNLRERRGMSRKLLARESRVSERYLAKLEAGAGNMSVVLLRRVAGALGVPVGALLGHEGDDHALRHATRSLLERVPLHRLDDVVARLSAEFGDVRDNRHERIALIGLRGAGKSTLGAMLADSLGVPLIESNREVARESGLPVSEVIALYGAAAYRRIERRVFERIARARRRAVIIAGGGIVHDEDAFELLLAQGDLRPMAGNEEAMDDLTRMLEAREPMYRRADDVVDTSGETAQQSFVKLRAIVAAAQRGTREWRT